MAKISIQILNRTGSLAAVSGSIYARPCCFTHRIPLIADKVAAVEADGTINLRRSFVADDLHDPQGNPVAVNAAIFFAPALKGRAAPQIMLERQKPELEMCLQVEVEWLEHSS